MTAITFKLPTKTVSEANRRDHWATRARRAKAQRLVAALAARAHWRSGVPYALVVTLTRIAPRPLDDDNLRGALKAVRDGIADALGVDDRDPRVTWAYGQQKGAPRAFGVEVRVSVGPEAKRAPGATSCK